CPARHKVHGSQGTAEPGYLLGLQAQSAARGSSSYSAKKGRCSHTASSCLPQSRGRHRVEPRAPKAWHSIFPTASGLAGGGEEGTRSILHACPVASFQRPSPQSCLPRAAPQDRWDIDTATASFLECMAR
ncbi:hypothetical protein CIB84_010242, partial [Bambusicola thoracicus]